MLEVRDDRPENLVDVSLVCWEAHDGAILFLQLVRRYLQSLGIGQAVQASTALTESASKTEAGERDLERERGSGRFGCATSDRSMAYSRSAPEQALGRSLESAKQEQRRESREGRPRSVQLRQAVRPRAPRVLKVRERQRR